MDDEKDLFEEFNKKADDIENQMFAFYADKILQGEDIRKQVESFTPEEKRRVHLRTIRRTLEEKLKLFEKNDYENEFDKLASYLIYKFEEIELENDAKNLFSDEELNEFRIKKELCLEKFTAHFEKFGKANKEFSLAEIPATIFYIIKRLRTQIGIMEQLTKTVESERHSKSRKKIAKNAVNARHNQPDGSNDKRKKLIAIWQSGKYKTKSACAEAEHERLGMSLDTAKKALRDSKKAAST